MSLKNMGARRARMGMKLTEVNKRLAESVERLPIGARRWHSPLCPRFERRMRDMIFLLVENEASAAVTLMGVMHPSFWRLLG